MDLETLQVIFDMNTAKIQPKLDELQRQFDSIFGKIKGKMDVSDGEERMTKQAETMNEQFKTIMDKFSTILGDGSGNAAKVMSNNIKQMKASTTKDVDSMMEMINSKMESARAAEERMLNLKGLRSNALSTGDTKTASRIDEQAASAQARMTRYQSQAKALAQELKGELGGIPIQLTRIARGMDENEGKINSIKRKIEALKIAETDAMKLDPSKGFDAEPSVATKQSRAIAEQIQKERSKMEKLIDSSDALNSTYAKLEDRSKELKHAMGGLNTELGEQHNGTRSMRESFSSLSNSLGRVASRVRSVMSTLGKVTGITRMSQAMKRMNSDSRGLMSRLSELGSRGSSSFNRLGRGSKKARSSLSELKQGLRSLPAQFIVWGIGFAALQKFSEGLLNAAKSDRQFNSSLNQVKANLMTAFYPLYATIIPWLDKFMNVLAKATGWLAQFSAALFGMSNGAARSGAANLYKQTKAMGDSSTATSKATKALQKQNAAITAHNKAMQQAVQKENQAIQKRNAARRKALQDQNSQIRAANEKRKQAVEEANEKIKASNKKVAEAVAAQNEAQKKRIAELKKKYEDYKTSLMGFDEINTLDLSKDIPDYTLKKAKQQALKKYKPIPLKDTNFTPEPLKTYTPKATRTNTGAYVPDGVDNALAKPMSAFGGAAEAAKKFKAALKDFFKPIKEAWDKEGKGVVNAFKRALNEWAGLIKAIGRSFNKVWQSNIGVTTIRDFLRLLRTMLDIVGDIGKSFRQAWNDHGAGTRLIRSMFELLDSVLKTLNAIGKSFRKAWNDNGLGKRIIGELLRIFTDINRTLKSISDSFRKAWTTGDTGTKMFKAWLTAVDKILRLLDDFVRAFRGAWNEGSVGTKIFGDILKIATNIGKIVGNLAGQFDKAWNSGRTGQSIFHIILSAVKDILDDIKNMSGATASWAKKLNFKPLLQSIKSLFSSIKGLNKTVWDALAWAYKNVLLPLAKFTITKALPSFFKVLAAAIKVVNSVLKAVKPLFLWLWNSFLKPIAGFTGSVVIGAINLLAKALNKLSDWITKHKTAAKWLLGTIGTLMAVKYTSRGYSSLITDLGKVIVNVQKAKGVGSIIKNMFGKITGLSDLKKAIEYTKSLKNIPGLGKVATNLKSGWTALKNWSIWGKLAAGAQAALNAVMAVNPYVLLAAAIAAVVVVFVELYKHNKKFREFVNNVYKNITKWLGKAITWVKKNWKQIGSFILNPVGTIAAWFLKDTKTGKNIQKWAKARLKDVTNWAKGIGKGISDKVDKGKKFATKAGTKIGKWVNGFRTGASKTIKKWAGKIGSTVHDGVDGAKKLAKKAGSKVGTWVNGFRTKASKTIKKWAGALGDKVHDGISGAKKMATKAGKTVGGWVNDFREKASKTIKTWATKLGSKVHDGISGAKKLAQKAGKTLGGWVNDFRTKASKTTKDWSKALGSKVRDGIKGAKSLANKAGTTLGGYVNAFRTKASTTAKNWAKGLGDKVHTGISGAKSLATKAGTKLGGWVSNFRTKTGQTISKWAGGLGGKIGGGLEKGVDAVKRGAKKIAQGIVNIIGGAVNGVISGIKWILRKVGASGMANSIKPWSIPKFARGGVHQGGLAVVNDEDRENYQESFMLPNGQQGLFPKKRNLVTMLPYGTKIKTAVDTERDIFKQLPHYAKGVSGTTWNFSLPTGHGSYRMSFGPVLSEVAQSVMNSVFRAVKGISGGNVLWDANHPKSIISQFTDRYDSFRSSNSLGTTLGKSANSVIRSGATSMVKDGLRHFADQALDKMHGIIDAAVNAYKRAVEAFKNMMKKLAGKKKRKGREFGGLVTESDEYPLAEHNNPEMVVPLTKPRLALKYIDESLQRMGYVGTGVTMPTAMNKVNNSAVLPSNGGSSSAQIQGDGVSGMQQAIVNSVMMAMTQQKSTQMSDSGRPIEVTVKIGDESFGKHAIKGINAVNRKNGHNMLNL